jgi:serine/threonine protein kinase
MRLESLPGSVLDQKYRVERQLGEGAMGAVFQATHLGTMRPVAVKVIVPQLAGNQEFGQRFKREAEAAGRLTHPNVVNVTDFGVTQFGKLDLAYLVMEYLDGGSLADYLAKNPRPTFNFLLDVMDQTSLAVDAAHAAGIVHRDLKPSNIWLEPNHRGGYNVKVLDFGIAKVANGTVEERASAAEAIETVVMAPHEVEEGFSLGFAEPENRLGTPSNLKTTFGALLGTPSYMAPEQCSNIEVNALADVYSMAVIAYQMLCGQLPFKADSLTELIRQQIQTTPKSPREHDETVPEALAKIVLSGLEKDPALRPPTAGAFAARLRAASDGELSVLRKSKDVFHTHPRPFFGVQVACLAVLVAVMIPTFLAAEWAARHRLASDGALFVAISCCFTLFTLFEFQIFKAACTLILRRASETGQFQSTGGPALKALAKGFGSLVRTQLLSALDLRPSSWWANVLWPVVWAAEGRSGKDAIARSRQLCETLPTASASVTVRQYGPALLGTLAFPAAISLMDSTGGGLHFFMKEALAGSFFGWFVFFYPVIFGVMFVNFASAFPFLYQSALRCRDEGAEMTLPAATRDASRKAASSRVRPATLMWVGLPAIMLALIIWRASGSVAARALDEASSDGRRTAVLKLIDGGVSVEQLNSGHQTALFDAVRSGDEKLVEELFKRGAKVNVKSLSGTTPLLVAAASGRNELAQVLLDRGASADAADDSGQTPLIVAAMRGNAALAKLLLDHGANASLKDTRGNTAAAYAREEGYGDLAELLSPRTK